MVDMVSTLGVSNITSAYRNPRHEKLMGRGGNSFHVYGRAIDYDEGSSEANYNVAKGAAGTTTAENYLYDQNENRYDVDELPVWPELPDGVTEYTHGHVAK